MTLPHRQYAAELTRTLTDEVNSDAVQELLEAKGVDYDHTDIAEIEALIEDAGNCRHCFHHADRHTYGAGDWRRVPCGDCPGEVCRRG